MTVMQQVITIAAVIFGTVLTRSLPFIVFPANKRTPYFVRYLGVCLPSAVFGLLVVYSLKNTTILTGSHGIPEFMAISVTVIVHLLKKNMLLSIACGTLAYMLLIHFVF